MPWDTKALHGHYYLNIQNWIVISNCAFHYCRFSISSLNQTDCKIRLYDLLLFLGELNMSLFPCLNLNVLNFVFFNACLHILVVKCLFIYKYIKLLKKYRSFPLLKIRLKRTTIHFCYRKNMIKEQKITYIFMDDLRFKTWFIGCSTPRRFGLTCWDRGLWTCLMGR